MLKSAEYLISEEPWFRKNVMKWTSYDLGNTIYSMVVVSLTLTPLITIIYFNRGLTGSDAVKAGLLAVSTVFLISNLIMAVISPFLGAYADHQPKRRSLLMKLTIPCVIFMSFLFLSLYTDNVFLILFIFLLANIFYQMGLVVYDSMLPFIADKHNVAKISGLGVAIGYFGSFIGIGLGFYLATRYGDWETNPVTSDSVAGAVDVFEIGYIPYIYPLAGITFLLFALPMFRLREKPNPRGDITVKHIRSEVVSQVKSTAREIRNYRSMFLFLIGWLIYIDAANTVILFMTPIVTIGLGFESGTVLIVLGIGILSAVLFTYPIGVYVDKNGPRKGLVIVTGLWVSAMLIAFFTSLNFAGLKTPDWPVYVFPLVLGPGLGGTWVVQRQFLTELAPPDKVGNYFGFANIFGRISAAFGPYIFAFSVIILEEQTSLDISLANRFSILTIAVLMLIGFFILLKVDNVHEAYLNGGRATGDGRWIDSEGTVLYTAKK